MPKDQNIIRINARKRVWTLHRMEGAHRVEEAVDFTTDWWSESDLEALEIPPGLQLFRRQQHPGPSVDPANYTYWFQLSGKPIEVWHLEVFALSDKQVLRQRIQRLLPLIERIQPMLGKLSYGGEIIDDISVDHATGAVGIVLSGRDFHFEPADAYQELTKIAKAADAVRVLKALDKHSHFDKYTAVPRAQIQREVGLSAYQVGKALEQLQGRGMAHKVSKGWRRDP